MTDLLAHTRAVLAIADHLLAHPNDTLDEHQCDALDAARAAIAFNSKASTTSGRTAAFQSAFPAEYSFLLDNITASEFYRSLWTQAAKWGRLSEKQMACIRKAMK